MQNKTVIFKVLGAAIVVLLFLFWIGRENIQFILVPKYFFFLLTSIAALLLLSLKRLTSIVRIIVLSLGFILFGVLIGIHPSPLCALAKPLARYHIIGFIPPPMIVMAGAMVFFSILGNKIFCGWICPLGCLQEFIYKVSKGLKKIQVSFFITNSVRFSLILLFSIYVYFFEMNIYDLFNPFELFHWHLDTYIIVIISMVIAGSLIFFRPFCHFLCPAGFLTWIFEQISIFKIHKNIDKCTQCKKCIKEGPCAAIEPIINDKKIVPDCYACGKCIESCPEDALTFSLK
jgi:polyferredoxin